MRGARSAARVRAGRSSERDVVVEIGRPATPATGRRRLGEALAALGTGRAGTAAAAVEHGELAAEALQHHLGRGALLARLVAPFPGLQRPFQVDLAPLSEVLLRHLAQSLVEDHDPVPLGALAALAAVLVAPALGSSQGEGDHLRPILGRAHLRVPAQIADENDLVDAARHDRPLFLVCSDFTRLAPIWESILASGALQALAIGFGVPAEQSLLLRRADIGDRDALGQARQPLA